MLFLMNTVILDLGPETDPRQNGSFPLTDAQVQAVPLNTVIGMLTEEFTRDPDFLVNKTELVVRFAWMLNIKAGINAIKMTYQNGASAQYGKVPDLALGVLQDMQKRKPLTPDIVDEGVWNKLQRQK